MPVKEASLKNLNKANTHKRDCQFCARKCTLSNLLKHEKKCKKNPSTWKECPSCKKMHSKDGITCSYGCSNSYFRSGENNPNWKEDSVTPRSYRSTCFLHHEKKCIVCGEEKIVAVHHMDENRKNNNPSNLVPLCPTHHQYIHSRYRDEVLPIVEEYMKNFKEKG